VQNFRSQTIARQSRDVFVVEGATTAELLVVKALWKTNATTTQRLFNVIPLQSIKAHMAFARKAVSAHCGAVSIGFCHHFPDLFTMFEISRFHRQLDRARNADFRFFDLGTETQTKKKLRPNVVEAQPSWSAIPVTVSKVQLNSKGELDETAIGSSQRVVFTSTRFPHRVSDKAELKPNQEEYDAILLTYDLEDSRVMSTLRFD